MSFKKCKDLILGVVMLALSVAYTVYARQIKTRPKLTPSYASAQIIPTLLGVLLAILSLCLIFQGVRKLRTAGEAGGQKMSRVDLLSVTLTFAAMVLYIVLLPNLGFILSTIIFLFLQITILAPTEKRNLLLFAVIAVVFTAIAFVAFRIGLSQLLPRGPIEALLGF
ncbi:MAG: tripartite tricarboxylate transporter TctB family protein [Clostridia bacterium]|nr:tripartite tricarboxylate transporter TctB family protein [Clostridia bacterium]